MNIFNVLTYKQNKKNRENPLDEMINTYVHTIKEDRSFMGGEVV